MATAPRWDLNDGHSIPALGFGTYAIAGDGAPDLMVGAIDVGYRLLDTATRYDNEVEVGRAVAQSPVHREELFVTTKLPGDSHGYDETLRAFEQSLGRLDLDYVDLYLIHWPLPRVDAYVDSWRAFIRLREEGIVRSIGTSNFLPEHIDRLRAETDVVPALNQVELHPYLPQTAQRAYHREHQIVTQSWTPLGRKTDLLEHSALAQIAQKHGKTPAQIVLRWHVDVGAASIPKSATPARFAENSEIFDFTLDDDDLARIAELETGRRIGGDPATHEEF